MEFKNKKLIIGLALTGAGLIVSEVKKRRKVDEFTKRVNYTESFLEDLEEKAKGRTGKPQKKQL